MGSRGAFLLEMLFHSTIACWPKKEREERNRERNGMVADMPSHKPCGMSGQCGSMKELTD